MRLFRELRHAGVGLVEAMEVAFVPLRIRVVIHVLRGRPLIYGVSFIGPVQLGPNDRLLIASTFIGAPE